MTALARTFGIEIECYLPAGVPHQTAAAAVGRRLGQPCLAMGYTHQRTPHWKIVTDGSLSDYARGMELVSPVLTGESGLDLVAAACSALADLGATVNKGCGFHVHVGIGEADPVPLAKNLLKLYAAFERPVLDAMMPASRRGSTNNYSKSMTTVNLTRLDAARNMAEIDAALGGSDRYRKVNIAPAYAKYKTFEFRQHSGTLESNKARKWVAICLRMIAAAAEGKTPVAAVAAATQPSRNRARHGSKSWQVGEMMLRPEGVTGPEICAALGWPSVSIPQQASICGLEYTTERVGRTVRYRAVGIEAAAPVAAPAPTGTPLTPEGFAALIEATEDERNYITSRIRDLSGPVDWVA